MPQPPWSCADRKCWDSITDGGARPCRLAGRVWPSLPCLFRTPCILAVEERIPAATEQTGTKMRSGHFDRGKRVGEWITYDKKGARYKTTVIATDE
jgi:hypothetical protein